MKLCMPIIFLFDQERKHYAWRKNFFSWSRK